MTHEEKPQVNLEISSGFFRIPTENLVYNLTVIGEQTGVQIVERIVEREKAKETPAASPSVTATDPFFEDLCHQACRDMATVIRENCSREQQPGQSLENIFSELAAVKDSLGAALPVKGHGETPEIADLVGKMQEAARLVGEMNIAEDQDESASIPAAAISQAEPASRERYVFDLDVIFQTLYELCTNEQVKSHITAARENRDTYFDIESFLNTINEKVASLEADSDNFFNVPMSDVFHSLSISCSEKQFQNLMKKMDSNQASIFLDQFLPLEVPPTETITEDAPVEPEPEVLVEEGVVGNLHPNVPLLAGCLQEALAELDTLAGTVAGNSGGQQDLSPMVERLEEIYTHLASATAPTEVEPCFESNRKLLVTLLTLHNTLKGEGAKGDAAAQALADAESAVKGMDKNQDIVAYLDAQGL